MKAYLLSLGAGLLVGAIYALLNVRSPAPPVIALLGLLGMLLGEQIPPAARTLAARVGHGWARPAVHPEPPVAPLPDAPERGAPPH